MRLLLILLFITKVSFCQEVEGYWTTVDENGTEKSIVNIYKTDKNTLEGKIYKILNPKRKNAKCIKCKGELKNKPLEGLTIIENMTFEDNEWKDGSITDPQNGKTYDCKIWIEKDQPNTLYVRGYLGIFYRTQKWLRAKNPN